MSGNDEILRALDAIVAGGRAFELETETLDFKTVVSRSEQDTTKKLAEAAACFANGRGGALVVGVADRTAGPEALAGCDLEPDHVKRRIFELTEPGLVVWADKLTHSGAALLVIKVPSSPVVHAVGGRSTERIGTSCEPMTTNRIAQLVAERSGDDWSAHDSGLGVNDADPLAIAVARSMLDRASDSVRRRHARKTDADLLRALGVVTERRTLTNAGVLLFTDAIGEKAEVAYIFRRTPTGALAVNDHLSQPLVLTVQRVFDAIEARLDRSSVNLGGGQQVQLAELPEAALREAVINAVMHRDYRQASSIVVEHAPTRFAVTSPGPFVSGVSPDNVLTTSSRPRNPQLATAIRNLGLAETAGTGVDRMYAEMARIGHQPPSYTADGEHVRVTLLGGAPNAHLARFTASMPREETEDADTMLVLLTLLTQRTVSAPQLVALLQRSVIETQTVLERLAAQPALVESTRESARMTFPDYRLLGRVLAELGPAVTYNRRAATDDDRKIIGLVRESGEINGRTVQLVLDLNSEAASRVLRDLVDRGILVKTSKAQRGRGVTYGPGPDFPKAKRRSELP